MITASIVTYHTSPDDLNRLISCVMCSPIEKLFIIDHSDDDSLHEYVEGNDRIRYIHNENRGYGAGHNIGINLALEASSDYHVVLNHDVYWVEKVIESLYAFMESNKDCGLVMPNILYPNGNLQYLCKLVPTPADLFLRRFIPIKKWQDRHSRNYEMHWTGYDRVMEVPILSGCFMFLRSEVLKDVKGFDERFFLYAEDVDLCRRIGEIAKTVFYPKVSVFHEYAKGSYKSKKMMKMHIASIIKYFNKWGWIFDSKRDARNKDCTDRIKGDLVGADNSDISCFRAADTIPENIASRKAVTELG